MKKETATVREKLEAERAKIKAEIDTFQFPCPDCKKNVGKIVWDVENGGECPHCLAHIDPPDFQPLINSLDLKWKRIFQIALLVTEESMREHVAELRKSLEPWRRFLERGCRTEDFTSGVYKILHSTFYHIAHTDRSGFYAEKFDTLSDTVETLSRMRKFVENKERSDKDSPMAKLENEIVDVLEETEVLPKLTKRLAEETRHSELLELKRLQEKYGPTDGPTNS